MLQCQQRLLNISNCRSNINSEMLGTQADFHFTLFNEKFYPQEFFLLTPINLLLSLKYVSYFYLVGYFLQLKLSYYILKM